MALISDAYREQNRLMHERIASYGASGRKNAEEVKRLASKYNARTVLDYGCGKKGLEKGLQGSGLMVINYDPAVPEHAADPPQSDLVICTDVLEHIEPDCLDDVLKHIASKMLMAGMFLVACRPANKKLPDGRNAHLIIEPAKWWLEKVSSQFHVAASRNVVHQDEVAIWVEA